MRTSPSRINVRTLSTNSIRPSPPLQQPCLVCHNFADQARLSAVACIRFVMLISFVSLSPLGQDCTISSARRVIKQPVSRKGSHSLQVYIGTSSAGIAELGILRECLPFRDVRGDV